MTATVTVVTPTRDRPDTLLRAMASVAAQVGVYTEHIVVGDDCPWLARPESRRRLAAEFPTATVLRPPSRPARSAGYLPARLAHLRNLGVRHGHGDYVAHLDDDNVFQPEHLSSLVATLEAVDGAEAAHSWRRLLTADGREFVPDGEDPWHPDPAGRAEAYERLRRAGVFSPGSPIVRDALRVGGRILARVDTSEYLVRRSLHARIPFPERFNRWQQQLEITEDLAFSHALIKARVVVARSGRATLDYYMGGYSNA
jgi:glycosyltransferase involved in cell wall biosynthesis